MRQKRLGRGEGRQEPRVQFIPATELDATGCRARHVQRLKLEFLTGERRDGRQRNRERPVPLCIGDRRSESEEGEWVEQQITAMQELRLRLGSRSEDHGDAQDR
jgi:hypothetical protein